MFITEHDLTQHTCSIIVVFQAELQYNIITKPHLWYINLLKVTYNQYFIFIS